MNKANFGRILFFKKTQPSANAIALIVLAVLFMALPTLSYADIIPAKNAAENPVLIEAAQRPSKASFTNSPIATPTTAPQITAPTCMPENSGDLAEHMTNGLNAKIALSGNATNELSLWTQRSLTLGGTFKRNPNLWTSLGGNPAKPTLDLSGVSPLNVHPDYEGYGNQKAGTLISPRHIVLATHYPVRIGAKMVFIDQAGISYERTLLATKEISRSDITIGVLDRDLPSTIAIYEALDYASYIKKTRLINGQNPEALMLSLNQDGNVFLHAMLGTYSGGQLDGGDVRGQFSHSYLYIPGPMQSAIANTPITPKRLALTGALRDGDSGYPNFIVINGKLVLLGTHFRSTSADMIGSRAVAIDAAMKELGGNHTLKLVDLGCFTNYR